MSNGCATAAGLSPPPGCCAPPCPGTGFAGSSLPPGRPGAGGAGGAMLGIEASLAGAGAASGSPYSSSEPPMVRPCSETVRAVASFGPNAPPAEGAGALPPQPSARQHPITTHHSDLADMSQRYAAEGALVSPDP